LPPRVFFSFFHRQRRILSFLGQDQEKKEWGAEKTRHGREAVP